MNREEILEKSRSENKQEDEREKQLRQTSFLPALISLGVVSIILMFAEFAFLDTEIITSSLSLALYAMLCVQNWYLLVVIKKKYLIATSILWTLSFLMAIVNVVTAFQKMM